MKHQMRHIKFIEIRLRYTDGNRVHVRSPESDKRIGLAQRIGWEIMLFGGWVMFGRSKEWQTIINPDVL